MTDENLKRASELKAEIDTFEAEIEVLNNMHHNRRYLELKKLLKIPTTKTYKHLYCTESIDSIDNIGSTVLLRQDEMEVLAKYKQEKVIKLKEELESL